MANIFCTHKLEKVIGNGHFKEEPVNNLLGNWNADVFYLQRRKCLLLLNDESYYALLFLGILKADFNNFHELFYSRLIEQLDYDEINFPFEHAPILLQETNPVFLKTNNNKKILGTLKHFIWETQYLVHYLFDGEIEKIKTPELNHRLTSQLIGALKPMKFDFGRPIEEMKRRVQSISPK